MAYQVGDAPSPRRKAASKPKKPRPTKLFRQPLATPNLGRKSAQRKVNRAASKLPQSKTPLPAIPKLKHPTHAQRQEALKLTSNAIQPKRLPGETAQHALTRLSKTGTKRIKGQTKQTTKNVRRLVTPQQRLALKEIAAGPTVKEGPKPKKINIAGVNVLPAITTTYKHLGEGLKPGLATLKLGDAGTHVLAGAVLGESPKKALNENPTFSDVLKKHGVHGALASIGGFGLDVASNPTSYVTFGAGSVAEKAAQDAAERVATKAVKAGMTHEAAKSLGETAYKKAIKEAGPGRKSLTVTAGKKTANTRLTLPKVGKEEGVARDLTKVLNPRIVPKGATRAQHEAVRTAQRAERGSHSHSMDTLLTRAHQFGKHFTETEQRQMLDAIEQNKIGKLADERLRNGAIRIRSDFRHMNRLERTAGVRSAQRQNYVYHLRSEAMEKKPKGRGFGGRAKFGPGKQRKINKTLRQIREQDLRDNVGSYVQDVPTLMAVRGEQSLRAVGRAKTTAEVVKQGRPLTRKNLETIGDHEGVYLVQPGKTPVEATNEQVQHALIKPGERVSMRQRVAEIEDLLSSKKPPKELTDEQRKERIALLEEALPGMKRSIAKQEGSGRYSFGGANATHLQRSVQQLEDELRQLREAKPTLSERAGLKEAPKGKARKVLEGERKRLLADSKAPPSGKLVIFNHDFVDRLTGKPTSKGGVRQAGSRLARRYDRLQGVYKTALTVMNPGYHPRNFIGDNWNSFLTQNLASLAKNNYEGVKVANELRRIRKGEASISVKPTDLTKGTTVKIHGRLIPSAEIANDARKLGVIDQGFYGRDVLDLLQRPPSGHGPVELSRRLGQYRENVVRLNTYIGGLKQGLTKREAAQRATDVHFDYGELSDAERKLRRAAPFYTFTARNTPLQARSLLQHPGKYTNFENLREEAAKAAGLNTSNKKDYQRQLQDYEQLGIPIPIPGVKVGGQPALSYLGLPVTDLNRLTLNPVEQGQQLGQMLTGFKTIPELIYNYSLFYRDKIDSGTPVSAPDWVGSLPESAKKKLGVVQLTDKKTGKKVWKWNARVDYAAKQLPQLSFLLQQMSSGNSRRNQGSGLNLLNQTGVKVQPFEPGQKQLNDAFQRYDKLESERGRTDAGSPQRKALNKEISKAAAEITAIQKQQHYKILFGQTGKPKAAPTSPLERELQKFTGQGGSGGSSSSLEKELQKFTGGG